MRRTIEGEPEHRVLPDGCVDIIFSRCGTQPGPLKVVGPMTRSHVFSVPAGQFFFGVRFRPAMSYGFLPLPGPVITDRSLPLDLLWGPAADRLHDQLAEAASVEQGIALFEANLNRQPSLGPVQRACAWLVQNHGRVPVDDLAEKAGLSARQFRRLCLDQAGLNAQAALPHPPLPVRVLTGAALPRRRLGTGGPQLRLLRPGPPHQRIPGIQWVQPKRGPRGTGRMTVFSNTRRRGLIQNGNPCVLLLPSASCCSPGWRALRLLPPRNKPDENHRGALRG